MRLSPFFLAILVSSIFGAAVVDTVFADVVPIRPYDLFFKWIPQSQSTENIRTVVSAVPNLKLMFTAGLLILILAAILPSLANLTTGITIAHTGFTPNPNVTATPGYVSVIRTVPLVAVGAAIGYLVDDMGTIL